MSDPIFLDATVTGGGVDDDRSMDERGGWHLGTVTWRARLDSRLGAVALFTPLCDTDEAGRPSWEVLAQDLRVEQAGWPSGRYPCCAECRTKMEVRERGRDDITADMAHLVTIRDLDEMELPC